MDSKMTMIIAVAVVAVVAVAGVALVMNNNKDKGGIPDEVSEYGLVYGNADGNTVIDDTDLDIIDAIIDDSSLLEKYPFADANRDGKIDSADREMVEKMIAKEKMKVYVLQFDSEDQTSVIECNFPLSKLAVNGGTNSRVIISVLDLTTVMVASATTTYISPVLDKELYNFRASDACTVLTTSASDGDRTTLAALDFDAMVTEISGLSGYGTEAFRSLYAEKDASFLQFSVDNTRECLQAVATLGILTGKDTLAKDYIDFSNAVQQKIKDAEGDRFGTVTVMNCVMSNSVSGTSSDYYKATLIAGGNNLADFAQTTKKFPDGSDNTWLLDPKYNPQYIFHFSSTIFGNEPTASTINSINNNFSETAAYQADHYYLMNGTIPLPVRVAYMAQIMYSDCFEDGWFISVLQDYFNKYVDNTVVVTDYKILWTTEDF